MFPYRHRYKYAHTYIHREDKLLHKVQVFFIVLQLFCRFLLLRESLSCLLINILYLICLAYALSIFPSTFPFLLLLSVPFILYIVLTLALYYARPAICVPEIPTWPKALPTSCTHTQTHK